LLEFSRASSLLLQAHKHE
jgi:hypothetical protein